MKDWKSTFAGLLSGYLATVGPLTAYLATVNHPKATEICTGLTAAGIVARVWLGIIQKDAPTVNVQTAETQGSKTTIVTTPAPLWSKSDG